MATTRIDQANLAADATFQSRVKASLISTCVSICNEASSAAFHSARERLASTVLNNPNAYLTQFALAAAVDATVAALAGSPFNQASVTDVAIDNAISAAFNTFFDRSA